MKEGVCQNRQEQIAYLSGVEITIRTHEEWSKVAEGEVRKIRYRGHLETLSVVVDNLGLKFPLVSENLKERSRQYRGERMDEKDLVLLHEVAVKENFQGIVVDSFAKSKNYPKGVRATDFMDLGVFLLQDGALVELVYLREEGKFATCDLDPEYALENELPAKALSRLKDHIQSQAEKGRALESLWEKLEEAFAESNPLGFFITEEFQESWQEIREGDSLGQLFPPRGHVEGSIILRRLRFAGIDSPEKLLSASEEELLDIRLIGEKRLEVLELVRDYLSSSRVQA